jgi:hypothetical protein
VKRVSTSSIETFTSGAEDGTVLGDWEPGVWCHVKVVLDRRTNTYSVWIDHQFKGDILFTAHSDTESINALALMSDHAGVKVYFDDVRVFTHVGDYGDTAQWNVDFQGDENHNNTYGQTNPVDYTEWGVYWNIFEVAALSAPWPGPTNYTANPSMDLLDGGGSSGPVKFSVIGDAYGWAGDAGDDPLTGDYLIILNGFGVTNDPTNWEITGLAPNAACQLTYYHRDNFVDRGINFVANGIETTISVPGSSVASALVTTDFLGRIRGTADSTGYNEGNWSALTITTVATTASNPHPADGATGVPIDVVLSWDPGYGATSHDVYFGTSSPPAFTGNQTPSSYNPGTLEPDTTYVWQIDEVVPTMEGPPIIHEGDVWDFTTGPPAEQRQLIKQEQKVFLRVITESLGLAWNGDQGQAGRGDGEVYVQIWIYWPTRTEPEYNNPQHHEFGPLGGDQEFPTGWIFEHPEGSGNYHLGYASVTDGKFGQVYFAMADCPVDNNLSINVLVWDDDSNAGLMAFVNIVKTIINIAVAKIPGASIATEAISELIDRLTDGGKTMLGRATNEVVEIATEEEISDLCECKSNETLAKTVNIALENLAKDAWRKCNAEGRTIVDGKVKHVTFKSRNIEPPDHIGWIGLDIAFGKAINAKSSHAISEGAADSKEIYCAELGQPDESIISAGFELGAALSSGPVSLASGASLLSESVSIALGAPLLSDSISREYSMFLDVDNNLATGAQGYPYDGAEFELVAQFDNSESPTYKLMQYSSNTGTFEEVPGGLYDGGVNIDGRTIFLQVELSSLGDPSGPIAGWGVVHEQGVVVDVLPEHPEQLALGLTPTYTFTGVPPMLISTDPPHDAIGVNRKTPIEIQFSKSMARPEAEAAFSISPPVSGSFAWQGNTVLFTPSSLLAPMTRYEVTIGAAATDRVGTLFDGNGDLTPGDSFSWEFISAGHPLFCCDVDGVERDVFCEAEPIYVTGAEFDAFSKVEIYIVRHARAELISGTELIDVTDNGSNRASIDAEGVLPATLVGSITEEGEYNIIVDVNSNGLFDPGVDRCDKTGIGFAVLPGPRLVADLNDDGVVDYLDMEILTGEWLDENDVQSDLNEDSKVDFKDYATQANAWLEDRMWPCEACVQEISNVKFHQVNWYDPNGTLAQENSLWGEMSFSYYPGNTTVYLNVTLANSLGGAEAWVVQNLPLFAVDNGDYSRRAEAVDVNLADLGMVVGQDWPEVYWKLSLDRSIRTEGLTEPSTFSYVEDVDWSPFYDIEVDDVTDLLDITGPDAPDGIKIKDVPSKKTVTRDIRRVYEDKKKCFAGACARSLDWLSRKYKLGMPGNPTAQQIYEDLKKAGVSDKTVSTTSRGRHTEWVKRKNSYARQKTGNKIITKVWDAGDLGDPTNWPNGQVDPIPGVSESSGDFLAWLKNELEHGEDVELGFFYQNRRGGKVKGHMVTVVGLSTTRSGTFVEYRDDKRQTGREKTSGDKKLRRAKITKRTTGKLAGMYRFGRKRSVICLAISESPDKNQNGIGDGFESEIPGEVE